MQFSFAGRNFVALRGHWGADFECGFVFVYSSCDGAGKRRLWAEVMAKMEEFGGENWCVLGNFNEVTCLAERKRVGNNGWTTKMEDV